MPTTRSQVEGHLNQPAPEDIVSHTEVSHFPQSDGPSTSTPPVPERQVATPTPQVQEPQVTTLGRDNGEDQRPRSPSSIASFESLNSEHPTLVWQVLDRLLQQEQRMHAHTERLEQRLQEQSEQMQKLIASQIKNAESQARKNLAFPAPTDFSHVPKLEKSWHGWENHLTTWLTARSLSPLAEWIFAVHDQKRRQILEDYFQSASIEVRPMLISDTHRLISNILNASAIKITAYQNMKQTLGSSHTEVSDPYRVLKHLQDLFANVADDRGISTNGYKHIEHYNLT
eukprot:766897-Hanusia_phi.AAC.3